MNRTPSVVPFGTTPAGEPVSLITLTNNVISCQIITYGAAIRSLFVPDRSGTPIDVVLGYDTLDEYMTHDVYLGTTIGRFANRIAEGHFKLNGKNYSLSRNNETTTSTAERLDFLIAYGKLSSCRRIPLR